MSAVSAVSYVDGDKIKGRGLVRDGVFVRGKYEGDSVQIVLRDDPDYIAWLVELGYLRQEREERANG